MNAAEKSSGFAQPALTAQDVQRYSRQMLLPEIGATGQKRLHDARILVVGAGGLGAPAALYLAAAGVGRIDIIDFDAVDISNLHRQVLFTTDDVGQPKVEVAAQRLRALNPGIQVTGLRQRLDTENALAAIGACDLVIDASDNFRTRYIVNDACVLTGTPLIYASIFRFEGLISVFAAPDGPCYRCLYPEPPPAGLVPSCAEGGVLGVLPGVMGLLQATEALKVLLGIGTPMIGRLLQYDALTLRFEEFEIARDPACPICSPDAEKTLRAIPSEAAAGEDQAVAAKAQSIASEALRSALRRGDRITIVDVREASEFQTGAIPGALHIPLGQIEERLAELSRDQKIVCYCLSGARSNRAANALKAHGFDPVVSLDGGILGWTLSATET